MLRLRYLRSPSPLKSDVAIAPGPSRASALGTGFVSHGWAWQLCCGQAKTSRPERNRHVRLTSRERLVLEEGGCRCEVSGDAQPFALRTRLTRSAERPLCPNCRCGRGASVGAAIDAVIDWCTASAPVLAPAVLLHTACGQYARRRLRRWRQQHLTKDGHCVEILAPPAVAPRGGEVLRAQLSGLLRQWWRRITTVSRTSVSSRPGPTPECASGCGCPPRCPWAWFAVRSKPRGGHPGGASGLFRQAGARGNNGASLRASSARPDEASGWIASTRAPTASPVRPDPVARRATYCGPRCSPARGTPVEPRWSAGSSHTCWSGPRQCAHVTQRRGTAAPIRCSGRTE